MKQFPDTHKRIERQTQNEIATYVANRCDGTGPKKYFIYSLRFT